MGHRRAFFESRWGENYQRNFGGPEGGFMGSLPRGDSPNSSGAFGKVIGVGSSTLIVVSSEGTEKAIVLKEGTVIERFRNRIAAKDIAVGDYVVVIGRPNESGQIEADFVRAMPSSTYGQGRGMMGGWGMFR